MRYERNKILTEDGATKVRNARILVIGLGGLGGYIMEMLLRIGVGHLTLVDKDNFDLTNLNRQLLSTEANIGVDKVIVAKDRAKAVNSEVSVECIKAHADKDNMPSLIKGHDLVIDALDSINVRLELERCCEELGVPLIHGAIAGYFGQVATIMPGDRLLCKIYKDTDQRGVETITGNPSFTPALVASIQVSEAIKYITGDGELIRNKILYIDLRANDFMLLDM